MSVGVNAYSWDIIQFLLVIFDYNSVYIMR